MRLRIALVLLAGAAAAQAEPVATQAVAPAAISAMARESPREQAARFLLAGGAGLLAASVGVALSAPPGGSGRTAGVAATVLAATGFGAVAAGGLVLLVSPSGAAVQARF